MPVVKEVARLQTRLSEVQEKLDDANRAREAAENRAAKIEADQGELYYRGSLYKLASRLEELPVDAMLFEVEVRLR